MDKDLLELIPQREPIIMVHHVVSAEETGFETNFTIKEDNIFLKGNILQEPALIENIAQSAAAGFGTVAKKNGGKKGGLGFIGSVSRLKCHKLPKVGDTINTKVEVGTKFGAITLIIAKNYVDGELLLECEMKIVTGV
ncbi:MAG: hypothetical protein ACPGVH_03765 [Chitinophagales bacterium]